MQSKQDSLKFVYKTDAFSVRRMQINQIVGLAKDIPLKREWYGAQIYKMKLDGIIYITEQLTMVFKATIRTLTNMHMETRLL